MPFPILKRLIPWEKSNHASSTPLINNRRPSTDGRASDLRPNNASYQTMAIADLEAPACRDGGETRPSSRGGRFRIDARVISDATIGLSDGLTVPFALTAGLSALGKTKVVIFGGLAELIAGAISMGLGGYLGAKSEVASYKETRARTERAIASDPLGTAADVRSVFAPFELPKATLDDLATHLSSSSPVRLADFLIEFHHGVQEPASSRAITSAVTIALGYFVGGLLPLLPYFCVGERELYRGLYISIAVMAFSLFAFGYAKTCVVTGWKSSRRVRLGVVGGLQMMVVGGAAAGAAWGLVRAFDGFLHDG